MKAGWGLVVVVLALAAVGAGVVAFDAWMLEERTLAAAGQVGDALATFGLAALFVAIWSLRVQQRELATQASALNEQRREQAAQIAALKAQAEAVGALVAVVRAVEGAGATRLLAERYAAWLAALDSLARAWDAEHHRQELDIALERSGSPRAKPMSEDMRTEMRRLRAELAAAQLALRLVEHERDMVPEIDALTRYPEIGRPLPNPGRFKEVARGHLIVFLQARRAHRERLDAFITRIEQRLGVVPIERPAGDERETVDEAEPVADDQTDKPTE